MSQQWTAVFALTGIMQKSARPQSRLF